jgi:hypothetical protein
MIVKVKKNEVRKVFGKFKEFYRVCGRFPDGYMLRVGIWDKDGFLTGSSKAERYTRISHLITAYVIKFGSLEGIPENWIKYAMQQQETG